jgi:hypothetical protein
VEETSKRWILVFISDMSSHHFVKEGQEPALLIMNGVSFERAQPLLEWSPFIVVASEALEKVLSWGIRIDAVIIQSDDELTVKQRFSQFQDVDLIVIAKPEELLAACVRFTRNKMHPELNILCPTLEEIFPSLEEAGDMRVTVLANDYRWITTRSYRKWVSAGTQFNLRAASGDAKILLSGFIRRGESLLAEKDGFVAVFSPQALWIGESY